MKVAKWCNKCLIPCVLGTLLLLFGIVCSINRYLISSLSVVFLLLILAFLVRIPYVKEKRGYKYFYCLLAVSIFAVCIDIVGAFFFDLFIILLINAIMSVPLAYLIYRCLRQINLKEIYVINDEATVEEKRNHAEFSKFPANTLVGLWLLLVISLITFFVGKTNWLFYSVFLPIFIIADVFTLRHILLLIVYKTWIGVKPYRIVINILLIVTFVTLALVFSDDEAFYNAEGKFEILVLFGVLIAFYFPFKTGHIVARQLYGKKKNKDIFDNEKENKCQ